MAVERADEHRRAWIDPFIARKYGGMYSIHIYIYIYVYICETQALGLRVNGSSSTGGARGHCFDFGIVFIDKTAQGSPWGDALQ